MALIASVSGNPPLGESSGSGRAAAAQDLPRSVRNAPETDNLPEPGAARP